MPNETKESPTPEQEILPDTAAAVGLPGAPTEVEEELRREGIDPDRLSINQLGHPVELSEYATPPWIKRMGLGVLLWLIVSGLQMSGVVLSEWSLAGLALLIGLIILQGACEALVTASERLAARLQWNHYVAGTVAEILSTLPELVVIAFIVPISPLTAFVIALITIYNNALVFSLYSYFLPKDKQGKFLMPKPITEVGTQILTAGAAMGLILGLVMLSFSSNPHPKTSFYTIDLVIISAILLTIFGVYVYKLVVHYAEEEQEVREALDLSPREVKHRLALVYKNVEIGPLTIIALLLLLGIGGALLGGEQVAEFAKIAIKDLGLNDILTALILAGFAGMSEYVILWKSHRKKEYGIALANAFGGITQVMFLVLPFTLLSIAIYQGILMPDHPGLPIHFTLSNIFLLIFLFPTFFVLVELIQKDHTLGILDATIMTVIVLMLIMLLVTYGADGYYSL